VSADDETRPSDLELKRRVGYVIQRARMARGLTAPALAERMHTTPKTINRWEKGEAAPSLIDLAPLCEALSLNPQAFIDLPADPVSRYLLLADVAVASAEEDAAQEADPSPEADDRPDVGPRRRSA
jgi:transcriptional regulator with XRE-family HTH domain